MVNDSSNIDQIKRKYKDLYDIDVEVEYDEENNVYLIETKNNEIIYATDSLDKELDRLETIEASTASSGGGGGYLPSPQPIGTRRQERALNAEEVQIYMFFSSMYSIISNLNEMGTMPLNCDTSYASCLSGELRSYYNGLGDNTKAALAALAVSIQGLGRATANSVMLCEENADKDLKDLEDEINGLYDKVDESIALLNNLDDITDEELDKIIIRTAYENSDELPPGILLDMIESDTSLTEDNKKYLNEQIEKGNIRSSIGLLLELNEQKKLDAMSIELQPQIDSKNDLLTRLDSIQNIVRNRKLNYGEWKKYVSGNEELENIFGNDFFTYSSTNYEENMGIVSNIYNCYTQTGKEIRTMNMTLNQQRKLVNQYRHSKEEWEYDYLLKDMPDMYSGENMDDLVLKAALLGDLGQANFDYYDKEFKLSYLNETELLAYKYFDDDHKKMYYYLYETEGKESADKYLKAFSNSLNQASGWEKANEIFNNIVNGTNDGYLKGIGVSTFEGIQIGTEKWFDVVGTLFNNDSGDYTDSEYTIQYVNQLLSGTSYLQTLNTDTLSSLKEKNIIDDNVYRSFKDRVGSGEVITYGELLHQIGKIDDSSYARIKEFENDPDLMKFADQVNNEKGFLGKNKLDWLETTFGAGVSVGNMLPSVVGAIATSGILGTAGVGTSVASKIGQKVGLSLMFLDSFAESKNESIRDGRTLFESYVYGILSGASEVLTEKFLGGVTGLSNLSKLTELTATSKHGVTIMKSLLNFLVREPLAEIAEEQLQQFIITPAIESIIDGYSTTEFNWDDAVNLAISTYLSTLMLNSGSTITNTIGTINTSNEVVSYTLEDGSNISLTYGQLMDCMDANGKFDVNKLNQITGKTHTTSGLKKLARILLLPLGMGVVGGGVGTTSGVTSTNTSNVGNSNVVQLNLETIEEDLDVKVVRRTRYYSDGRVETTYDVTESDNTNVIKTDENGILQKDLSWEDVCNYYKYNKIFSASSELEIKIKKNGHREPQNIMEHLRGYCNGTGMEGAHVLPKGTEVTKEHPLLYSITSNNTVYDVTVNVLSIDQETGIFNASVEFTDTRTGRTVASSQTKTFFPTDLKEEAMRSATQNAYSTALVKLNNAKKRNPTINTVVQYYDIVYKKDNGKTVTIKTKMVVGNDGKIITVHPIG